MQQWLWWSLFRKANYSLNQVALIIVNLKTIECVCAIMNLIIIVSKGQLFIKLSCVDNCQFDNNLIGLCNNDFDDHHFKISKWFVVIMFFTKDLKSWHVEFICKEWRLESCVILMAIVFIIVCTSLPQLGRWNVASLVMWEPLICWVMTCFYEGEQLFCWVTTSSTSSTCSKT